MIFLHIDRLLPGPKGENGSNSKYCRNRNRNGNRNRNRNRNVQKSLSMFVHQLVALIIFIRVNRIEHQSKF